MPNVPPTTDAIQLEETDFTSPGSESMIQKVAGLLNYLLDAVDQSAVGEAEWSQLTEVQFQAQRGSNWILADGRDVSSSRYHSITTQTNVPDLRGLFLRADQGSRVDGKGNLDGPQALGTYNADNLASHSHPVTRTSFEASTWDSRIVGHSGTNRQDVEAINASIGIAIGDGGGGAETAPYHVTGNWFMRIN